MLQHEVQRCVIQACIERIKYGTRHRHTEMHFHHFREIGQHHCDGVVLAYPQPRQSARESSAPLFGLAPVATHLAINHRGTVTIDLCRTSYEIQRRQRREIDVTALQTLVEIRHVGSLPEVVISLF